jgi:hypothetical protein
MIAAMHKLLIAIYSVAKHRRPSVVRTLAPNSVSSSFKALPTAP